jgi:hypothetical protein
MAYGPRGDHAGDKAFGGGPDGGGHDGFMRARGRRELPVPPSSIYRIPPLLHDLHTKTFPADGSLLHYALRHAEFQPAMASCLTISTFDHHLLFLPIPRLLPFALFLVLSGLAARKCFITALCKARVGAKMSSRRKLTEPDPGPVTDYGATVVHWMRHREPRYKGSYRGEAERPSPSYIVDVSAQKTHVCRIPLKR